MLGQTTVLAAGSIGKGGPLAFGLGLAFIVLIVVISTVMKRRGH